MYYLNMASVLHIVRDGHPEDAGVRLVVRTAYNAGGKQLLSEAETTDLIGKSCAAEGVEEPYKTGLRKGHKWRIFENLGQTKADVEPQPQPKEGTTK